MLIFYRILFTDAHFKLLSCDYAASRVDASGRALRALERAERARKRVPWSHCIVSEIALPASGNAEYRELFRLDSPACA